MEPSHLQPAAVGIPIKCDKPTKDEIRSGIMHAKKNKAPGPADIPAETLKKEIDTSVEHQLSLGKP